MRRWILLAALFVLSFFLSLWIYIYSYRTELVRLGLASAFPQEITHLAHIDSGFRQRSVELALYDITITSSAAETSQQILSIPKIEIEIPLASLLLWAIWPSKSPLHIEQLSAYVASVDSAMKSLPHPICQTEPFSFTAASTRVYYLDRSLSAPARPAPDTIRTMIETISILCIDSSK